MYILGILSVVVALGFCASMVISTTLKSPFKYPYCEFTVDITGKQKPKKEDVIDNFLINNGFKRVEEHNKYVLNWQKECFDRISGSGLLKRYRECQYEECLDPKKCYIFHVVRKQTRYKQKNYVKAPYLVTKSEGSFSCSYRYLQDRNARLGGINYECTLRKYNSDNQRSLMTKKLRQQIMARDSYTCQMCGKYMPDEVGLQIDHIIPVSAGGKTISSNLQVLCSKCNGRKSNKLM